MINTLQLVQRDTLPAEITTSRFKYCIGVFEGGGTRAAAFAGAYKAALRHGVDFQGTVGTSSGSIVATLIACGITPDTLLEITSRPFKEYLHPPESSLSVGQALVSAGASMLGQRAEKLSDIYFRQGEFSSKRIENEVNKLIRQLLPESHDPPIFRDLPRAVALIATDLSKKSYKVWGTTQTPDDPIGLAVRCSCTIPFLFEPVRIDNSMFVDGGVLANLAVFLAPEILQDSQLPILCFRLKSDSATPPSLPKTTPQFLEAIVETVIRGSTDVQLALMGNQFVIDIPTGTAKSTDFSLSSAEVAKLISSGEQAVTEFIGGEQRLTGLYPSTPHTSDPRSDLLVETAERIRNARNSISIFAGDLTWMEELIIPILAARQRGVLIRVICEKGNSKQYSSGLKAALSVGAEIIQLDRTPHIRGTLIDAQTDSATLLKVETEPTVHGSSHSCQSEPRFVRQITEDFETIWTSNVAISMDDAPKLTPVKVEALTLALKRGVLQYSKTTIQLQHVKISELQPLTKFLETFKLERAKDLEHVLSESGLESAAHLVGGPWIISPPVIEQLKDGSLVIVDGLHRIYNAKMKGLTDIRVLLVRNSDHALPAVPLRNLGHVTISNRRRPRNQRYSSFNEIHFREIKRAFYDHFSEK